ncbi:DUF4247 domain-containing protein [Streptomyces qinzhouensis]|uniref:DUF4247 domain-containing protein n=1 Tax=Streptomyces qinzhouensis TaxID=2599401 RepID=A0A5B8JDG2_9ACTN|nr:DUF4247 domain-containing protein [Streptomyces qinzhouensis]QDY79537.1 DUF4247 domain-containing protein [Streptomyces qinzhouensis]
MKTARRISVILLAAAALTACSSDDDKDATKYNDVPIQWIRGEYTASPSGYTDPVDDHNTVADEIHTNTASRDRVSGASTVYLRYDDDIVAVTRQPRGSLIEIQDYRSGYSRWHHHLRTSSWPDPATQSFRGGGPGSGK